MNYWYIVLVASVLAIASNTFWVVHNIVTGAVTHKTITSGILTVVLLVLFPFIIKEVVAARKHRRRC